MFCENCGAKIDEDSKFCENCGEPVKAEAAIKFKEGYDDPLQGSRAEEELYDLHELMELDRKDDPVASLEKTMVFVKPSSSSKESEKVMEETGQEKKDQTGTDASDTELERQDEPSRQFQSQSASQMEGRLRTVRKTAADNTGLVVHNKSGKTSKSEDLKAEEMKQEADVSIKSGIDPEDEFFVEPRVGAIRKNLPVVELVEDVPEPEEEAVEPETAETARPVGTAETMEPAALKELETPKNKEQTVTEAAGKENDEQEAASPAVPNQESEGSSGGYEPLFCMACGKTLPRGAAFCDACGTRTGAVSPAEIRGRRQSKQGLAFGLLADFFIRPESTIERAADEDACLSGIGFFLFKDVILAILGAAFMKKITISLGIVGPWLTGGDSFGFAAKVFLCAIVMDALWVGILFGAGYLFRTDCPIKILIGACGTASLLPTALLIIATLLIAFVPPVAMGAIAVTVLATLIVMTKAAAAAFIPPQDRLLYLMVASTAVYAVILVAAMSLIGITLFAQ
ncbi:zinc-ribbon domain-containing protein [Clostridiales bacterium]|nr:zinc-ribbon domain-containing protein [Clostridiales bacterium]